MTTKSQYSSIAPIKGQTGLSSHLANIWNKADSYGVFDLRSESSALSLGDHSEFLQQQLERLRSPLPPSSFVALDAKQPIAQQLFDATAEVKILTSQVAMHLDKKFRGNLFNQIDQLHDLNEWMMDDKPINKLSFLTFLRAILQIKPLHYPGLGLTYDGKLIAAWTAAHNRLTVEFHAKDWIKWVISRQIDGEVERAAGETHVTRLYSCLTPYDPRQWFGNESENH